MSGQFDRWSSLFHIPDQNEAILGASGQQRFASVIVTSVTPLDGVHCAATAIECDLGLAIIRAPDADVLVVGATCEELAL